MNPLTKTSFSNSDFRGIGGSVAGPTSAAGPPTPMPTSSPYYRVNTSQSRPVTGMESFNSLNSLVHPMGPTVVPNKLQNPNTPSPMLDRDYNTHLQDAIYRAMNPDKFRIPTVWENPMGEYTNGHMVSDTGSRAKEAYKSWLAAQTPENGPGISRYLQSPQDTGVRPGRGGPPMDLNNVPYSYQV